MVENKYGAPGSIESTVLGAVSVLPYGKFKDWVSAYFRPVAVMKAEAGSASLGSAAKNFAIYGLILGIIMGLVALLLGLVMGGGSGIVGGLMAFAAMAILFPILSLVGGMISSGLYFVFAKLFGGKGIFNAQTYMLSMINGGMVLLLIPFQVLGAIPIVGTIFAFGSVAVSLYAIYSEYRMLKELHQLSTLKAVGVILGPVILALIIAVVLVVVLGAMLFGLIGGAMAGAAAAR